MTDKQLKDKTIKVRGGDYVLVKDRILFFNDIYKNGSIVTSLLTEPDNDHYVVKATVYPDVTQGNRVFTGLSQAKLGSSGADQDAALENAETSAVGRALAMMGIGVVDSIASVDEMNKAGVGNKSYSKPSESKKDDRLATEKQVNAIYKMAKHKKIELSTLAERYELEGTTDKDFAKMSMAKASEIIGDLQNG